MIAILLQYKRLLSLARVQVEHMFVDIQIDGVKQAMIYEDEGSSVMQFKERIFHFPKIEPWSIELTSKGKRMKNRRSLSHYGIENGDEIELKEKSSKVPVHIEESDEEKKRAAAGVVEKPKDKSEVTENELKKFKDQQSSLPTQAAYRIRVC